MTLRLGGSGRTTSPAIASLSIVAALACGITAVGCSSSSGGGGGTTSTADAGSDTGTTVPDAQADQTVLGQCTTPTFAPATGATLAAGATVTVTATGLPANGFIYYTTDGTLPTHGSTVVTSGGTIAVNASETIHAIAYAMGACADSAPATATYTVLVPDSGSPQPEASAPQCGPPTFVPDGGTVTLGSTVTIDPPAGFPANFPAGNAFVYYTTNGTVPTHASTAYAGPIEISGSESIRAIAYYPGVCTDSNPTLATYSTIAPDGGVLVPPAFNPTATTGNNDFLVSLTESGNPAATICFTLGQGTTAPTPTCTVTATSATCAGSSQTYNAGAGLGAPGSVTINGGVTDANGNVTVSAIACSPGNATTTPLPQTYKLQAAAPTMQGTAASPLPWIAGGYMPTLASTTTGASLRYSGYSTGTAPALGCTTGTLLVNNASVAINPGPLPVTQNITYEGVACKPGYAPSAVVSFPYQVVLGAPTFVDATTTTLAEGTGTYDRTLNINIAGAGPSDLWACYSTTAEAPTCGTTVSTCGGGATAVTPTTAVAISATATTVTAIDCSLVANASPAATATYTLQLDRPGLDLPGCANTSGTPGTCRAAGAGAPLTSYAFTAAQAGAPLGTFIEESLGTGAPPSNATQPSYGFACITQGAGNLPTCVATGCGNGTNVGTGGAFTTANTVPGPNANVGDVWNVVGCPGTTVATGAGLAPSAVTSVAFTAPGLPPVPAILPAGGTFNSPIAASITNESTSAGNICYTLDGTTPTCTTATGACGGTGVTVTQAIAVPGTSTVTGLTLTAGGSGYTSAPTATIAAPATGTQAVAGTPTIGFSVASITLTAGGTVCAPNTTVTIAAPPAAILGGIAGTTATATATVSQAGVITGITLTSGGSGYTSAPAVSFTGCTGTAPTATAALATTGSVIGVLVTTAGSGYTTVPAVSFTGGGGTGASATATLSPPAGTYRITNLQTDVAGTPASTTTLNALLCVAGAGGSPVATETYTFAIPAPTVSDVTPTTPVNLVNGSTLPIGDQIQFSTASTFFTPGAPSIPLSICYTTDGSTPTCPCTGTGTSLATVTGTTASTTAPLMTNAAFFATNTLKAIACSVGSLQPPSAVYTANLALTAQTPVATPIGGAYYNTQSVTLASTAGTTICYTTDGTTPTCSAGTCPAGSTPYTAAIPVNQTNTIIKAVACSAALASAVSSNTYTLSVAPIILTDNPTDPAACPTTATLNFDCATMGECSTATFNAGGATHVTGGVHPTICYSTNGSAVTSCTAVAGSIACFDPTLTSASIPLNQSTTIQALGCLTSAGITFNNSAATLPVTFSPYPPPTITVDGSVADWTANEAVTTTAGGTGYFTYNATTLYFALSGGYTTAGTTYVGIYIGNGSATGAASTGLPALGSAPISPTAGIRYAFQWPTDGSAAPVAYTWNAGTASWGAGAFTPTVGNTAGTATAEFSIPLSSLPAITSTVTALGSVVSGVPAAPVPVYTFPGAPIGGAYADWYDDVFGSCLDPNAQVH